MVESACEEVVGSSAHSFAIRKFIRGAAGSNDPVMLLGEPGVGKELVARRIHGESSRRTEPLLMIDCSLYYERELRREIFGYRGVDQRSRSRKGLLEFASMGTCYLSHIEELSPLLQDDLLGFLRTGRFRTLGKARELPSSVRLVLSTDKNLEGFVQGGLFSRELYERLSPFRLDILPLRERPEDVEDVVAAMAESFRVENALESGHVFSRESLEALKCFPWPRNFDDLRKEIGRLFRGSSQFIEPDDLSFEISSYWLGQRGDPDVRRVVEELEGHIREFKVLSRLDAEFGDILFKVSDWELELEAETS